MLDLNHPDTRHIIKASGYLGRINHLCREYILQDFNQRQETFSKMLEECEGLITHSSVHFPEMMNRIQSMTQQLVDEINRLKTINEQTATGNCTVCNHPLHRFDSLVKSVGWLTTCNHCANAIYKLLNELEGPTGVMWI